MTRLRAGLVVAFALVTLSAAASAQVADATLALSKEQIRQFLLTAKVVKHKDLSKGVTRPLRLTLSDGVLTHDAVFSACPRDHADHEVPEWAHGAGFRRLGTAYNIAAYRLAELIGLDNMMPVTVEREYEHHKGSLAGGSM